METLNQKQVKITTVSDLIKALNKASQFGGYLGVLRSMDIPIREFERYYTWNNQRYTRNCLVQTKDYELMLACWEEGQESPIHDYDSHEAWVHPICGKIKEERFRLIDREKLEKVSSVVLGPSEFSFMSGKISIHRYVNVYDARSVTLHLYARPVTRWKVYDYPVGKTSQVNVAFDSIAGNS